MAKGFALPEVNRSPSRRRALRGRKRLKTQVQNRLITGAEIVALEVTPDEHPLMKFAGMFKDNPLLYEWKKAMAEYRDQVEKDDDYL